MAQRSRSRARRDPDLDDDVRGVSPRAERRRSDDDEELGNEDLTLEIVARAERRQRKSRRRRSEDALSPSSDEEVDEDAVVELGEAPESRRKQRKKQRRKLKKKHRKEAAEAAAAAAGKEKEEEVGVTQEGQTGTAESVLTEDGVDISAPDNKILRKLLRIPRYFDPGETLLATCFNCVHAGSRLFHLQERWSYGKRLP
ncbi:hypothetical protein QOZ80_9BG0710860 [Eleusine coracana subsp. coracana]|nr:hypothetical protein QOZ80_9BG0710860 [Eleusine coracana subsp. coracana]